MPGSGTNTARILLVRNDRIGDLVLTTPAIEVLRRSRPEARIDLLCSAYAEPVVRHNPHLDNILTCRGAHDLSDLAELVQTVKERAYGCAVVFVHSWKNARLVRAGRIPLRVGPLVKLYSPLFFNQPVRQKRSLAEKNEAEYNLDLLKKLGIVPPPVPPLPVVVPSPRAAVRAKELVEELFGPAAEGKLVIVHPGMGGSALNWPLERWRELVALLAGREGLRVVVTGSESERKLAETTVHAASAKTNVKVVCGLDLEDFIGLVSLADALAAPSTGPLHLAAAVGVPVVAGIYSPVRAHHPRRWGPLGAGRIRTFLPPVDCPGKLACLGDKCAEFPCMGRIEAEEVCEFLVGGLDQGTEAQRHKGTK